MFYLFASVCHAFLAYVGLVPTDRGAAQVCLPAQDIPSDVEETGSDFSNMFPLRGLFSSYVDHWNAPQAVLEEMGMRFLRPVENASNLQHVELPSDWTFDGESAIHDQYGRLRVTFEIKCLDDKWVEQPVYRVATRYQYWTSMSHDLQSGQMVHTAYIMDGQVFLHAIERRVDADDLDVDRAMLRGIEMLAQVYLDERWPDWRDPTKYWD